MFIKISSPSTQNTCTSYEVSLLLAQHLKPFSEGDFVKSCMLATLDAICPEMKDTFSKLSLSASTVTRCVEEMAADVRCMLQDRCRSLRCFSLAVDERTDVRDMAQLSVFLRGVNDRMEVFEEFLEIIPMKGTITGADVLEAPLPCFDRFGLDLSCLSAITTESAPAMVGLEKGFATLLKKHCAALGHTQQIKCLHCIVHQEALCAKSASMKEVMGVVVKVVNFIISRGLNHRQVRDFLEAAKAQYGDLLYHCEVRCLSRGSMLARFSDPDWFSRLAFLTDLFHHLNELNLQLQGRSLLVTEMFACLNAFELKLRLLESQLGKGDFTHFPRLKSCEFCDAPDFATSTIGCLRVEFAAHFKDLRSHSQQFQLFSSPFDVDCDAAPPDVQMELIDLQCCDDLRGKYLASSLLDFWSLHILLSGNYPNLVWLALNTASIFGSTYCCEQLFNRMKLLKNQTRAQLTDAHLSDVLLLSVSSIKPDVVTLSAGFQKSHLCC
uniref:HAT C-terminal dimerisation domain-containing protein n=1 Tax=Eptatretus burgeri TaxID=7764 RepID=A0A8C4WQP7_EPTBU